MSGTYSHGFYKMSVLVALLFALAAPISGQSSVTNCQQFGSQITCRTSSGVIVVPNYTAQAIQSFATGLTQAIIARRQAQLQRQYQEQRNQIAIEAQQAETERWAAAARLFQLKSQEVLYTVGGQLNLRGPLGDSFFAAARESLVDLFRVNPLASQQQILEAVMPYVQRFQRDETAFILSLFQPYAQKFDALHLTPGQLETAVAELIQDGRKLYRENPAATSQDAEPVAEKVYEKYRVLAHADSTPMSKKRK